MRGYMLKNSELLKGHTPDEITTFDYTYSANSFDGAFKGVHFLGNYYNAFGEVVGCFEAQTFGEIKTLFEIYFEEV